MYTDYYRRLGVAYNVKPDALKAAYRAKASELHPDRCKVPGAVDLMAEVTVAYETLSDPEKRRVYDLLIRKTIEAAACKTCKNERVIIKRKGWKVYQMPCPECDPK
jgi:DnaJ-class molecular chaperone